MQHDEFLEIMQPLRHTLGNLALTKIPVGCLITPQTGSQSFIFFSLRCNLGEWLSLDLSSRDASGQGSPIDDSKDRLGAPDVISRDHSIRERKDLRWRKPDGRVSMREHMRLIQGVRIGEVEIPISPIPFRLDVNTTTPWG